ncbi:LOW QUALITY PROTEIN: protein DD3-3-like [Amphiura filiformis]|uniref:LOW QUALITY PROTEIN: protein DD3-3-like n=1 Tax=Amphiura filiformis TaxID=82378 RepID=UPI003B218819
MGTMRFLLGLLGTFLVAVHGDIYMHNPRGSNNRLNEKSANRKNANRCFDSQNNNRGGYNVGDATDAAAQTENQQYNMEYFMSGNYKQYTDGEGVSQLVIEWTNQHGCGGNEDSDPHKLNCNMVIQYLCHEDNLGAADTDRLRDGTSTDTQKHTRIKDLDETPANARDRRDGDVDQDECLQEPWDWYDKCYNRERNAGLFTADQNLNQNNGNGYSSAIYTRQNPNGNRRGYECPEERDYYPYWHPSPWKDAAILVDDEEQCGYYKNESYNVKPKYECVEKYGNGNRKHWSRYNNEADCKANGGEWLAFTNYLEKHPNADNLDENQCKQQSGNGNTYIWGIPEGEKEPTCLLALDPPECMRAPWTRVNHLGNTRGRTASRYNWTIPHFPSGTEQRCILRIRYNISTDDYDPWNTDSSQNQDIIFGVQSPVQQNPYVDVAADHQPLRLAINTAQFGRTFQDRSHVFKIVPRPEVQGIDKAKIYNLNVRGKRGNIVQTYPAVEYDFIPNDLNIKTGELVHIQWTGSNTHNNGNPGGDGQTGDAGEGRGGTDRNNIVEIPTRNDNYPLPIENTNMWKGAEVIWIYHGKWGLSETDLAVNMASSGYYQCMTAATCQGQSAETKGKLNKLLDNAPASYQGALVRFAPGTYHYMGSRNNNFSNRSQKGTLTVRT